MVSEPPTPARSLSATSDPNTLGADQKSDLSSRDGFQVDVERTSSSGLVTDPYNLREGIRSDSQLEEIRRRKKGKAIVKYQNKQNDLISYLLKPMEEHTTEAKDEEDSARLFVKIAVWASLISNLALCIIQMYAAASSLSLSLLATGIDSVFDIGSNILLFWLHRKAAKLDNSKWPVGGARLESIGNVVYGSLMASVNLIVVVEAVRSLISKTNDDLKAFHLPSILAVAAALGVKFLLFLLCYPFRQNSSQVRVLWEDHRNDLWINTFGILMSTGGSKLRWYLDPMGAIIIGLGIIISWSRTIYGQFELLAGKSAPHEFLQLLIYNSMTFNDEIQKVDTVRAYHDESGPDYFVEIDIVMDATTPLYKAHDLSQLLQDKIEELPNVERAFVHVDYETTHRPEHRRHS
ncbi:CDF-like metal transporter [Guyanagaster necrorhizus]|uniref:CDF-like metal transporter n=1 Tax=Guyanagaster necrorhizus TaxID=856835 RepID=A0A9P8AXV0_9AGAR|nr:CDF-like metal transporter [Guyanagaster necrorhizus MCA 3950]KAG7451983.1 CDF-like metal transporter [Guyanagaster necrorhizus MCA 3950]